MREETFDLRDTVTMEALTKTTLPFFAIGCQRSPSDVVL